MWICTGSEYPRVESEAEKVPQPAAHAGCWSIGIEPLAERGMARRCGGVLSDFADLIRAVVVDDGDFHVVLGTVDGQGAAEFGPLVT